ncbi:MAG: hypothetical protein Q7S96_02095 [bacterium]|nr:hypothetical protein [bacterium]
MLIGTAPFAGCLIVGILIGMSIADAKPRWQAWLSSCVVWFIAVGSCCYDWFVGTCTLAESGALLIFSVFAWISCLFTSGHTDATTPAREG